MVGLSSGNGVRGLLSGCGGSASAAMNARRIDFLRAGRLAFTVFLPLDFLFAMDFSHTGGCAKGETQSSAVLQCKSLSPGPRRLYQISCMPVRTR